jgi:hypothetical protein
MKDFFTVSVTKKIRILQEFELPLLIEKGFMPKPMGVTSNCNAVTANPKNDTVGESLNSSFFLQKKFYLFLSR